MFDLNTSAAAARDEETYVHQVYDQIASHFSDTRYKVGPPVESLDSLLFDLK